VCRCSWSVIALRLTQPVGVNHAIKQKRAAAFEEIKS
jgi:hypothetical protein